MKINEELRKAAGDFVAREAGRESLITPTRADVSPDLKKATIYFTVIPDSAEENALNFMRRKRSDFKHYLKRLHFKVLPFVDFQIDYGEKNRLEIEEISQSQVIKDYIDSKEDMADENILSSDAGEPARQASD